MEEEEVAGEVNESVNAITISVEDEESVTGITGQEVLMLEKSGKNAGQSSK